MRPSARAQTKRMTASFNILIICVLPACSPQSYKAPVSDVMQPPGIRLQEHVVAQDETLYSIAWRYDMDHRELARANGIDGSFTIYPGQRLSLNLARATPAPQPTTAAPPKPVPVQRTAPPKQTSTTSRSENQTASSARVVAPAVGGDPDTWQWPAKGKILAYFESNGGLNKGIDIGGDLGEPVHAAANGSVVYSGSGLRGYGQLVIVKHSEKYLSAYAHNSSLLVKEGESVTAGQKIAEVGSTGADTVKLHFEIRYDGKPVNPLKYLPKR